MNGEGTGGGGAIAVLLGLWIAAALLIVGTDPLGEEPSAGDEAPVVVEAEQIVVFDEERQSDLEATPTRPPELPSCDGNACDELVTRAQLAGAFARVFQLPVTTADFFTDDDATPEQAAINRVAAAGITGGCGERRFCPDDTITRGQMASFFDRALNLPNADRDYFGDDDGIVHEAAVNRVAQAGLTVGCGEERYCPDGGVTLRQLIKFLERALALDEPIA